jgi:hypothetical protein
MQLINILKKKISEYNNFNNILKRKNQNLNPNLRGNYNINNNNMIFSERNGINNIYQNNRLLKNNNFGKISYK